MYSVGVGEVVEDESISFYTIPPTITVNNYE